MRIKEIPITSDAYPNRLRDIPNPPNKLYVLGNEKLLKSNGIAIIGSRDYSEYGKKYAVKFAKELAEQNLTIISGMALGIDTFAHQGALKVNGKTIAVLGCGFNNIFPKENIGLMEEILQADGAVVTEYMPNIKVASGRLIERNRIVSGLSMGVLVIEAMHRSGTSITAGMAKEQEKTVFCLPRNLGDKNGVGTNRLIKDGAKLVTNSNDILDYFQIPKIRVSNTIHKVKIPKEYETIYNAIEEQPTHIEVICKKLQTSISEINSALMLMEIEGYIKSLPGNFVEKVYDVL